MAEQASFRNDGKLKLLIIVGTRPEIIRLSCVIKKCRKYFDTILAHTGQNYDYTLNGIFFRDLALDAPDVYLDAVGADLGETMGNIIAKSYALMARLKPSVCRRRRTAGSWISSPTSISRIRSTQGVTLRTAACRRRGLT